MTFLGGKQDIIRGLKDLNKNYVSDETWRQMYGATSLAEQQAVSTLDYDYNQALNAAYASSLQSQNAIQGSALGQGYKQELMTQNQDAIVSAFEEYRNNYLSNLQSVTSQYDKTRQSIYDAYLSQEKELGEEAEKFQDYFSAYYKYAEWLTEDGRADFNEAGLYELIDPETGALKSPQDLFYLDKNKELSEESRRALYTLSKYANENVDATGRPRYSFSEYLASENKELGEWATATKNGIEHYNDKLFKEMFGIDKPGKGWATGETFGGMEDILNELDNDAYSFSLDDANIDKTDVYGVSNEDEINALKANDWKLGEKYSVDDFEDNLGSILEGQAGTWDSKSKWAKNAIKEARSGKLKEGTIIDVNVGGGTKFYMWYEGQFVKLDASYINRKTAKDVKQLSDGSSTLDGNVKFSPIFEVDGNHLTVALGSKGTMYDLMANTDDWLLGTAGVKGGKRDAVLEEVASLAKTGDLKDGTFININYGGGKPVYIYYKDGYFYSTRIS